MENDDLGSKKMNNKQNPNEEIGKENLAKNNPAITKLKAEVETDSTGNQKIVHRTHNIDNIDGIIEESDTGDIENPSTSIEIVSDKKSQRMIENADHNSDVTANRYPNSHPDNKEDKGNMKLDE